MKVLYLQTVDPSASSSAVSPGLSHADTSAAVVKSRSSVAATLPASPFTVKLGWSERERERKETRVVTGPLFLFSVLPSVNRLQTHRNINNSCLCWSN